LVKVDPLLLFEVAHNLARLLTLQRVIGAKLILEEPLARDNIDVVWSWNDGRRVVVVESGELILHSPSLVQVVEGSADR
jgi:hypothetical protein